ncbi:hypothetical protein K1T71_015248 [Dendrolimus kikuchii]|nr:hypothetical protein K1T71_015248 [Dendrolimus kikuchii]
MRMRREMPSTLFASPEHRALSKRIRKLVRRDLRCSNTRAIQAAIEQNRGSKVFLKPLGRSHLAKVRTADGRELTSHSEILAEVERFYGRLYSSRAERPSVQGANDPRAPLTRHYTEDIPEVDIGEIRTALGQLKNGRAPGDDAVTRTGEMSKNHEICGWPLFTRFLKTLVTRFQSPLREQQRICSTFGVANVHRRW